MKNSLKIDDLFMMWGAPYVDAVFRICLDREPTDAEMDYYLIKLNQGMHRIQVLEKITNSDESVVDLDKIQGAKQLLNKVKSRENWRKKLKPIRPIYLAITALEKRQAEQRVMLNSTYQLRSMLGDRSVANYKNELVNKHYQPNRRRQFDANLLSIKERAEFDNLISLLDIA